MKMLLRQNTPQDPAMSSLTIVVRKDIAKIDAQKMMMDQMLVMLRHQPARVVKAAETVAEDHGPETCSKRIGLNGFV